MDSTSQAKAVGDLSTVESRRQRVAPVEMEGKKKGKDSSIVVKSLLVILAMVVICCVILLYLYLTERAKRPNSITEKLMENSKRKTSKRRSYFGGSCWSKDCLHAASGKASTGSYGLCLPLCVECGMNICQMERYDSFLLRNLFEIKMNKTQQCNEQKFQNLKCI